MQFASACSCVDRGPQYKFDRYDGVFSGKVIAIDKSFSILHGDEDHVKFEVYEAWKGLDSKAVILQTGASGADASCGYYRFKEDEQYLVYADKEDFLTLIHVWLCGPELISEATDDLSYLSNKPSIELRNTLTNASGIIFYLTTTGVGIIAAGLTGFGAVRRIRRRSKKKTSEGTGS